MKETSLPESLKKLNIALRLDGLPRPLTLREESWRFIVLMLNLMNLAKVGMEQTVEQPQS